MDTFGGGGGGVGYACCSLGNGQSILYWTQSMEEKWREGRAGVGDGREMWGPGPLLVRFGTSTAHWITNPSEERFRIILDIIT